MTSRPPRLWISGSAALGASGYGSYGPAPFRSIPSAASARPPSRSCPQLPWWPASASPIAW